MCNHLFSVAMRWRCVVVFVKVLILLITMLIVSLWLTRFPFNNNPYHITNEKLSSKQKAPRETFLPQNSNKDKNWLLFPFLFRLEIVCESYLSSFLCLNKVTCNNVQWSANCCPNVQRLDHTKWQQYFAAFGAFTVQNYNKESRLCDPMHNLEPNAVKEMNYGLSGCHVLGFGIRGGSSLLSKAVA